MKPTYYVLKIQALNQDFSLLHQFTYRTKSEENGETWKDIYAVIEVKNGNAHIVSDGYHSRGKAIEVVNSFNGEQSETNYLFDSQR